MLHKLMSTRKLYMYKLLKDLKSPKATGPNNTLARLLETAADALDLGMSHKFKTSINKGNIPHPCPGLEVNTRHTSFKERQHIKTRNLGSRITNTNKWYDSGTCHP